MNFVASSKTEDIVTTAETSQPERSFSKLCVFLKASSKSVTEDTSQELMSPLNIFVSSKAAWRLFILATFHLLRPAPVKEFAPLKEFVKLVAEDKSHVPRSASNNAAL